MSNKYRTTFYIGVTADLEKRVLQHRSGEGSVFTSKYQCFDLVYYEEFSNIQYAIAREKQLKNWRREWKLNLIQEQNPEQIDLAEKWYS